MNPTRPSHRSSRIVSAPLLVGTLLLTGLVPLAGTASARASAPDPKAIEVAERVMAKLGGEEAWKATRFLRFDFAVEREGKTLMRRSHTWDRHTGRYRVAATDEKGRDVVVLMSLWTKDGRAWVGGEATSGEALAGLLESAHAWWVNDTYWLLMPYKLRDEGVVLEYAGLEAQDKGTWDKLLLTFEGVGLTPKDKYWVFVNRKTGLVDRWEYVLKGEDSAPTPWDWSGWKEHGGVLLASERVSPRDGTKILFPVLEAPASIPDAVFEQP